MGKTEYIKCPSCGMVINYKDALHQKCSYCGNENLTAQKDAVAEVCCNDGLVATVEGMDNVEHFICWLIDHCERDIITEEGLHRTYADFLKWHKQRGN